MTALDFERAGVVFKRYGLKITVLGPEETLPDLLPELTREVARRREVVARGTRRVPKSVLDGYGVCELCHDPIAPHHGGMCSLCSVAAVKLSEELEARKAALR